MIQLPTLQEWYSTMRADAKTLMEADDQIPTLSLLNVFLVVFAGAIKLLGDHLNNVANWVLPDRAQGEYLERYLTIYGIGISSGTAAEGTIICSGTATTVIPVGTRLQTVDGILYSTLNQGTIGSNGFSGEIQCRCERLGIIGNYNGSGLTFLSPIPGVDSTVTVSIPFVGGTEADNEIRSRQKLLNAIRNPNTLGLISDYERIALEQDGVGRVWVQRADYWTGPHTVLLTLATSENAPVGSTIVSNVQSVFNDDEYQQPGIIVKAADLEIEEIFLKVNIVPDTSGFRENVTTSLTAFFRDTIDPNETVLISALRSAVAASGVDDYTITELTPATGGDTSPRNYTPALGKKASFGGVTFV